MQIDKFDKNFLINSDITEPDIVWFDVNEPPFKIKGVIYDDNAKRYVRIPQEIAEKVSDGVAHINTWTAGGRVCFKTNSKYIAIQAETDQIGSLAQMSRSGLAGFDLYRRFNDKETYFTTFSPPEKWDAGYSGEIKTYGELTDYTLYFPIYNGVKKVFIGIKKDAIIDMADDNIREPPIVFYGSSITNGGCASRPGNTYPSILGRRLSMDFINLGFSGSAKGEKEMAEYVSVLDMSLLVIEYDSNAPSENWLEETHYPFYKIIRDKQPDLPIVIMSHCAALHAVYYEMKAGETWGSFDNRRKIIKSTYLRAKKAGDENIYYIDGREIFKGDEWDAVTTEGVHPNDFGFMRFAQYLEKIIKPLLKI